MLEFAFRWPLFFRGQSGRAIPEGKSMSLDPRDSDYLRLLVEAVARIATALERQCQAFPPVLPPKETSTTQIQNHPEIPEPKVPVIIGGFTRGEWVMTAQGKRRWMFTNGEGITKQCTKLCPFCGNCKNWKENDICIGLLSIVRRK